MMFDDVVHLDGDGRLLPGSVTRENLSAHRARVGRVSVLGPQQLLDAVHRVGLTGRGGGHFPTVRKLRPLVESGAGIVVVNGSEGETLSSKDAALLQLRPHLVLDGAQALARVVRAREVVVWLHAGADASASSIIAAADERERDTQHRNELPVRVLMGPARYLTGEASAAIAGVRGGDALPRFVVDPAKPWVDGEPVLLHNVETHARVGLLHASDVDDESSTLVTLSMHTHREVHEVRTDVSFAELFARAGLTPPSELLLGGFGGEWVRWRDVAALPIDPVALRAVGVSLGTGIIAVAPPGRTGLAWSAEILEWMAGESAGQCGPCIFGLPELSKRYSTATRARHISARRRRELNDLMALVERRGACRHPDGAVRMARSALQVFVGDGA